MPSGERNLMCHCSHPHTPVQQPAGFFTDSVSQDKLDGLDHFRLPTGMMANTVAGSTGQLDMELQSPFDPQIDESEDEDVESDLRQAAAEVWASRLQLQMLVLEESVKRRCREMSHRNRCRILKCVQ